MAHKTPRSAAFKVTGHLDPHTFATLVGKNAPSDPDLPRRRDQRWMPDRPPPGLTSRSCPHNRFARNLDPGRAHPTSRRLRSYDDGSKGCDRHCSTADNGDPGSVKGAVPAGCLVNPGDLGMRVARDDVQLLRCRCPIGEQLYRQPWSPGRPCTFLLEAAMISSAITRSLTLPVCEVRTRNWKARSSSSS
ncbi:MAG: hypothetical protein QOD35_3537 [Nocardioidaceae bacterium]|nr:hypothetical protein [Nocardioidaceae bacterium]